MFWLNFSSALFTSPSSLFEMFAFSMWSMPKDIVPWPRDCNLSPFEHKTPEESSSKNTSSRLCINSKIQLWQHLPPKINSDFYSTLHRYPIIQTWAWCVINQNTCTVVEWLLLPWLTHSPTPTQVKGNGSGARTLLTLLNSREIRVLSCPHHQLDLLWEACQCNLSLDSVSGHKANNKICGWCIHGRIMLRTQSLVKTWLLYNATHPCIWRWTIQAIFPKFFFKFFSKHWKGKTSQWNLCHETLFTLLTNLMKQMKFKYYFYQNDGVHFGK